MPKSFVLSMFAAAFVTTGIATSPDTSTTTRDRAPLAAVLDTGTIEIAPANAEPIVVARRRND